MSPTKFLLVSIFFIQVLTRFAIECLPISYSTFTKAHRSDFYLLHETDISGNAIQVTRDVRGAEISNLSGRVLLRTMFKLYSKKKDKTATFNSTFVLNIKPESSPNGEGLTFMLTKDAFIPENSQGQWLGMVNASTNGSSDTQTVAVEFDTDAVGCTKTTNVGLRIADIDSNHVGVNLNSISSIVQVPLIDHGVNLSTSSDVTVTILYDGVLKKLDIYVFNTTSPLPDSTTKPIISTNVALSDYLPEYVLIGFSASTGATTTQLNSIKSWFFTCTDIEDDSSHLVWFWTLISLVSFLSLCGFAYYTSRRIGKNKVRGYVPEEPERYPGIEQELTIATTAPQKYELKELIHATDSFNPTNKLGQGGFGAVYKGLLNNKEVAIKRISKDSRQGKQEFLSEIKTISGLHHKNLVKLLGWCYERNELLLVYEFMPNGSLEKLIFLDEYQNLNTPTTVLTWETRQAIIYGVGEALDYLHNGCEKRVLHRDIKASNIMLDSNFDARLGDFGLARTIRLSERTHHSTKKIAGTPGYIAPEYFHTGRASAQIDVYAFGILVLEVACGRKPRNWSDQQNHYVNAIVEWVWELHKKGEIIEAMDPRLNGEYQNNEAECVLLMGLACCHPNPYQRPTMRSVLQVLNGEADPPNVPVDKPAFMWPAMMHPSFSLDELSLSGGQITQLSEISGR